MFRITPGTWKGATTYDARDVTVAIEIDLRAAGRELEGEVRSEQFRQPGTLRGRHGLWTSTFTVQFPVFTVLENDGRLVEFRELIRTTYGADPANTLPHPLIHFELPRSFDRRHFEGTWHVPQCSVVDEATGWRIDAPTSTGKWWVERVEP